MDDRVHEEAGARVRAIGQRYTRGRHDLVEALLEAGRPVSIPELLELRPGLAQSSAYRNLSVLEQADVVHRVLGADEFARYELTEVLTEHHHHLVCTSCGQVTDYRIPAGVERSVTRAIAEIAADTGFKAEGHRLDLVGTCRACA